MENEELKILNNFVTNIIKEQRATRRWKYFFRLLILLLIIFAYFKLNSSAKSTKSSVKQIAVIKLSGIIDDTNNNYQLIKDGLENAFADKKTAAIIIKANSPGGSPVYSDMIYNEILRQKKLHPLINIDIVIEEMCASGCYYVAAATNHIYASAASIVGSIGVISPGFGVNKLFDKLGIDNRLIISGKNKAMGYPFSPPNHEQQLMQQKMLDEVHEQFINAVINGRGHKLKIHDPDIFSGRFWLGQDAIKLGLIDGFETVDSLARNKYHSDNLVDFTPATDPLDKISRKFGVSIEQFVKQTLLQNSQFLMS